MLNSSTEKGPSWNFKWIQAAQPGQGVNASHAAFRTNITERIDDALMNKSSNTSQLGLKQDPRKTFIGEYGKNTQVRNKNHIYTINTKYKHHVRQHLNYAAT